MVIGVLFLVGANMTRTQSVLQMLIAIAIAEEIQGLQNIAWKFCTEMEKRADSADISVLFFLMAVLIFWLYTRKRTVLFCTVLLALYY